MVKNERESRTLRLSSKVSDLASLARRIVNDERITESERPVLRNCQRLEVNYKSTQKQRPHFHFTVVPYYSKTQIEAEKALAARGLEIAWLKDPIDVAFLHIQGSGRLRFPDGETISVGYQASNG